MAGSAAFRGLLLIIYFSIEVEQWNVGRKTTVAAWYLTRSAFCSAAFKNGTGGTGHQARLGSGLHQNHAGHVRRPGYATEHPELVAAMVQSFAIRDLADAVRQAGAEIESGARAIANAIPEP